MNSLYNNPRRGWLLFLALWLGSFGLRHTTAAQTNAVLRPPSVPLVACDPYFSIWSPADKLTDADTVHWTGKPQRLTCVMRIDGKAFRLMGKDPAGVPALPQTHLEVLPTRTIYTFEGEGVRITLTFMTPALPDDLMVYSRPVTYLTLEASATDGKTHWIAGAFLASPEISVNDPLQEVTWGQTNLGPFTATFIGSLEQPVLQKKGDDLRIDWGYFYVAAPNMTTGPPTLDGTHEGVFPGVFLTDTARLGPDLRMGFFHDFTGPQTSLPASQAPTPVAMLDLSVAGQTPSARWLVLAYDDEYSIQYFGRKLRPYWRSKGDDAAALLQKSFADYDSLKRRCEEFDRDLMAALRQAGGEHYAQLCALAYRQCYAATKLVADVDGTPLLFPKENFSNGCIGTVDVIYPMAPQFLLFSPALTRAMLKPVLDYAVSPRWTFPFAPHDLGTYPLANGQVYGGGEKTEQDQMPVEETGNMLILLGALAQVEGNARFCDTYWPVLEKWADYLRARGFDPENQLCTDDFAGHLAHNVNLSAKAICGLGAFARLCERRGERARAMEFRKSARDFAARWAKEADDGDHFRLAFDKPGTWSQKYNLVWDRILGLDLFPDAVRRKEMDFYKTRENAFGLPLDVRKDYTKLDWTLWTATLTGDGKDFAAIVEPVCRWVNATPTRVPLTDWFDTKTGRKVGFQARSVVGGVFLRMLYDRAAWKAWASRGAQ